jgi:hypothetical protein
VTLQRLQRDELLAIHNTIDRDDPQTYITAANIVLNGSGIPCDSVNRAIAVLQTVLHSLLEADRYLEAALLCWGTTLFDPRPRSVRLIWNALMTKAKMLVMGAGSMGKSYTAIVWALLSWVRDPAYTSIKLVSTTAGHAKANTWSNLVRFHRESKIPLPGVAQATFIGLTTEDKHAAITIVAIPQGEDGKGRLQGFHPLPRPVPHPKFGPLSRVILIIDEAEDAPGGLWQGVGNMLGNEDAAGSVTVYAATNPKRRESAFGQRAEPEDGWDSLDIERSESWISGQGWFVLRLDGAKCENVIEKREVYNGLLTYRGFQNHVREGTNSANYYTFARGWYPVVGAAYNIVPPYVTQDLRGVYTFSRVIANIATLDPAFAEEGDEAVLTAGKYGIAIGFQPFNGEYQDFRDNPRYAIQAEQQFSIEKGKTQVMAKNIVKILRGLRVTPEWFAMDKTGNARGLYDLLSDSEVYGDILGIEWGEAATDKKILEEDNDTAEERYEGIVTEMWFAFSAYAEYGFIKLAPVIPIVPLLTQLVGRQYKRAGKTLQRAESKKDYKQRNSTKSPDHADSLIMMPHLVRMRGQTNAAILEGNRPDPQQREDEWADVNRRQTDGPIHKTKFVKTR